MLKVIFGSLFFFFLIGYLNLDCKPSNTTSDHGKDKIQDAEENISKAKIDIEEVINDSIEQFKKTSREIISNNEKTIADFRSKIAKRKNANQSKFKNEIAELERENNEMKVRLDQYKAVEEKNWSNFKREYNHDLEKLRKALKDFTNKNTR